MLQEILGELKRRGCRITEQRQTIIEAVLAVAGSRFTAYDVWERVKAIQPELGLDTIYRNIKLLEELGFLASIGGVGKEGNRYEVAGRDHHHHLVCLRCGKTECIDYCPIDDVLVNLVQERGYDLVRHQLELMGICRTCRQ
ncbi:Fur family transcriptional regulator [Azotosporobacter soli]|uniref:Fur family transcriptional regulator n=1 Tax=Azotosporobacter soli TaxID=3055040 RepID=UPI0031FF0EDC